MSKPYDHQDWDDGQGQQQLDLSRVFDFLRRRAKLIGLVGLLTVPPALVYPFLQEPVFEASATLAIQRAPEVLDFGADFMPSAPGRSSELARAMGVIQSDRVLGRVVDQMGDPRPNAPSGLAALSQRARDQLVRLGLAEPSRDLPPELLRQHRIGSVRRSVKISSEGGGTILVLTASGRRPQHASWLANAVAEAYVAYEQDERRAASHAAISWLSEKTNELRGRIRRKEEAMARLAQRLGTIPHDLDPAADSAKAQLSTELQAARLELLAVEERVAQLLPRLRAYRALASDEERRALQQRYSEAKLALEAARLRYTETHPEVLRLASVVAELGVALGPVRTTTDPEREQQLRELQGLESERGRLRARVDALRDALEDLVDTDVENADQVAEYERMDREVAVERQMLEVLLQRTNETIITAANETALVRVLDYAVTPLNAAGSKRKKLLVLGLGVAFTLAFGAGVARELLDQAVYDPDSVADTLGYPLLNTIPLIVDGSPPERQSTIQPATLAGESYRNLRTSILFAAGRTQLRSMLVTSAVASEGKTTTSINLAASFAQTGRKVLLIDADLRRPRIHRVLGLSQEPGLAEVLAGDLKAAEALQHAEEFGFDVITSGAPPVNPVDLLGSATFDLALSRLTASYELVVLDAPVLLSVSDALTLASRVEGVLLVAKPGGVDRRGLKHIREDLIRAGASVLGLVVTQVDAANPYVYPAYMRSPYTSSGSDAPRGGRGLSSAWSRWARRRGAG